MHALRTLALALLPVCMPALAAAADADRLNLAVADRHIIPGYAHLAETTAALHTAVTAHCAAGGGERHALHRPFADAFLAWQGIQHIRFGPIQVLARDFRFQLWPDKRGSVGKHLARLLATPDPSLLEADRFAAGSAAVQGFGALERLIFPRETPADRDWHCQLMTAQTANMRRMADETLAEWRDGEESHRQMFATASDGNAYYDSADELAARLLNNLHTQLERMVEQKLGRPLGTTPDRPLPRRAEAWRSGLSLAAIDANLRALQALYETGFAPRLADPALEAQMADHFTAARRHLDAAQAPLTDAVRDADGWAALDALRRELAALRHRVGNELAQALDLPLGFNSLDGD